MRDHELINVVGGATNYTSATFISAISRGINTIYNLGRAFGTAIRMIVSGKRCS